MMTTTYGADDDKLMAMMTVLMLLATWMSGRMTTDRQTGETRHEDWHDSRFGCM